VRGTIHFDGGAKGNPGPAACAFVVRDSEGNIVDQEGIRLGRRTNNHAEYAGLIAGLERALELGFTEVNVYGDSELVVLQVRGEYRVKSKGLKPLHKRAGILLSRFEKASVHHVPRGENREADWLLNQVLEAGARG
jgi:ribonuclease HI